MDNTLGDHLLIVDCSANLLSRKFAKDLETVISRAKDAGVRKIIVPGSSIKSNNEALRLTRIYPGDLYCTVGLHCQDSKKLLETPEYVEQFEQISKSDEVVGIGPCGIISESEENSEQVDLFEMQVKIALQLCKPLFICAKSDQKRILEILDRYCNLPPVIVKGFTGSAEEAEQFIRRGFYISINGCICKDKMNTGLVKILQENILSVDNLLLESDSPFTYPNTRASKLPPAIKSQITDVSYSYLLRYCTFQRNEPCSLPVIVELLAAFMQKNPKEIALATTYNALKLFKLSN